MSVGKTSEKLLQYRMYTPPETNRDVGVIGPEDWSRRWAMGESDWHKPAPDGLLTSNADRLLKKKSARVFVPLCGKALDLVWLYEQGHSVVGVELVEMPVRQLFTENNWPFTVEKLDGIDGSVYVSEDGRMKIYLTNIFYLNEGILGRFDAIWDKASFTAINADDRIRYRELMFSLMTENTQYLLKTMEYDEDNVWPGPPHSLKVDFIQEFFGEKCSVELLYEDDTKAKSPSKTEAETGQKEIQNKGDNLDSKNAQGETTSPPPKFRIADKEESRESVEMEKNGDSPEMTKDQGEKTLVSKANSFVEAISIFSFHIIRLFAFELKKDMH